MPLRRRFLGQSNARSLLRRVRSEPLTYSEVGMSLGTVAAPAEFHGLDVSAVVGTGEAAYDAVGTALMHWDLMRAAGFRVQAPSPSVVEGTEVAVAMPFGPVSIAGACRVVAVVAEPRRCGFAYGTLPQHPERGEEAFVVTWRDDDSVEMSIRAYSVAATWFSRLGGPVTRVVQRRAAKRYLRAARRIAATA